MERPLLPYSEPAQSRAVFVLSYVVESACSGRSQGQIKKVFLRIFEKDEDELFIFIEMAAILGFPATVFSLFKDSFKMKDKLDKRTEHICYVI